MIGKTGGLSIAFKMLGNTNVFRALPVDNNIYLCYNLNIFDYETIK